MRHQYQFSQSSANNDSRAASPYLYDPAVYNFAIKLAGIDKILFGSDYPLLAPEKYFSEMHQSGLAKNQMDQICGLNAKHLFNL